MNPHEQALAYRRAKRNYGLFVPTDDVQLYLLDGWTLAPDQDHRDGAHLLPPASRQEAA
jgi:hypothetical protein